MKRHLLIKTRNEKRKGLVTLSNGDNIAQFFIFSTNNINYHSLNKQNKEYIYDLTEEQYEKLKKFKISQISKMTKQQFFIFCGMEEFLI
jgi:hypothetical protein